MRKLMEGEKFSLRTEKEKSKKRILFVSVRSGFSGRKLAKGKTFLFAQRDNVAPKVI